jgi:hypothetical protein
MTFRVGGRQQASERVFDASQFPDKRSLIEGASKFFRGSAYSTPATADQAATNLDALVEYIEDWYITNLGRAIDVRITGIGRGAQAIENALHIIVVLHLAECSIIEKSWMRAILSSEKSYRKL